MTVRASGPLGVVERVTAFCREARARGLPVTPAESIDALRALEWIDVGDRTDLRLALRALLATHHDDLARFDALFAEWWAALGVAPPADGAARSKEQSSAPRAASDTQSDHDAATLTRWAKAGGHG